MQMLLFYEDEYINLFFNAFWKKLFLNLTFFFPFGG